MYLPISKKELSKLNQLCTNQKLNKLFNYRMDLLYSEDIFIHAVSTNQTSIVKKFIQNGADVNLDNGILILECCKNGDFDQTLQILLENNISIDKYYTQTINNCIEKNYTKCLQKLIQYSDSHPKQDFYFDLIIAEADYVDLDSEDTQINYTTENINVR